MNIRNRRQYFHDSLIELVGIKAGLAISTEKALTLLDIPGRDFAWLQGEPTEGLRIEAGALEEAFAYLLYQVGATDSPHPPPGLVVKFCIEYKVPIPPIWLEGYEEMLGGAHDERVTLMAAFSYLHQAIARERLPGVTFPKELASLPGMDTLLEQYRLRSISGDSMAKSRRWDGTIPLDDLFKTEKAPPDPKTYFDQRFIDYLAAQPRDLDKIHWRQLERLAGEYFRRQSYEVTLGPARADGGKDVVAVKRDDVVGPEMVLVQCKRYKEGNEVEIDEVKAFYQTMTDEGATRGLFATTSRLAAGARTYCDARQYRLKRAESENVQKWLAEMKTTADRPLDAED